jgi:signal transduction histidine kinase/ActR/RegA family two-component response regulator
VLLLEDDPSDAELVRRTLGGLYPQAHIALAETREEFLEHLAAEPVDVVVSDSSVRGCEGVKAFHLARSCKPHIGFVYLTGFKEAERDTPALKALGVTAFLTKPDLSTLGIAVEESLVDRDRSRQSSGRLAGYERLVSIVTDLSQARDLSKVTAIVCAAARDLVHADGATFVLREGPLCVTVDEDAIGPLWRGRKFPTNGCLSGWSIVHRQPAVVPDIFSDPRIPISAYAPTFVRSAVVVPMRALDPIGAVGVYWTEPRAPHPQEVRLLQELADAAAFAVDSVRTYERLEQEARKRTTELEAFAYAVSHDLRTPVRHIEAFAGMLADDHGPSLDDHLSHKIEGITTAATRMRLMLDGLLELARAGQTVINRQPVDLADIARELAKEFRQVNGRPVEFVCCDTLPTTGDDRLLRSVLQNLLSNAWKFSSQTPAPRVEVGLEPGAPQVYFVRDNGVGFDPASASKLFGVFQRLHAEEDFPGTGVGLSIVERIVQKHGGRIWAESKPGEGATFYFTLYGREAE